MKTENLSYTKWNNYAGMNGIFQCIELFQLLAMGMVLREALITRDRERRKECFDRQNKWISVEYLTSKHTRKLNTKQMIVQGINIYFRY